MARTSTSRSSAAGRGGRKAKPASSLSQAEATAQGLLSKLGPAEAAALNDEMMRRDPASLSDADIQVVVQFQREQRRNFQLRAVKRDARKQGIEEES